ncbi:MAG: N,N-dimethylformamidase beta subunit family domain-containing protein, partial [Ralstonia sp.]|uniref:N,N-dimethylformamidase beta subunit family domain-containing protein n=1 Tax=Ralstonia sp. TaxID=54061 RepID=UPI003F7F5960
MPPRFYRYDLPFLHWLYWSGKSAEFISDSDFDLIPNGDELAQDYDLIVFEGHEEYVTAHEYDDIERFRNLGGNLMFLSANNFFWKVTRAGHTLRRVTMWRKLRRPEAALVGTQWSASNYGTGQAPYVVEGATSTPWA